MAQGVIPLKAESFVYAPGAVQFVAASGSGAMGKAPGGAEMKIVDGRGW